MERTTTAHAQAVQQRQLSWCLVLKPPTCAAALRVHHTPAHSHSASHRVLEQPPQTMLQTQARQVCVLRIYGIHCTTYGNSHCTLQCQGGQTNITRSGCKVTQRVNSHMGTTVLNKESIWGLGMRMYLQRLPAAAHRRHRATAAPQCRCGEPTGVHISQKSRRHQATHSCPPASPDKASSHKTRRVMPKQAA